MNDPYFDEAARRRRTWLIAGVLSLVVVLIGIGASFALLTVRGSGTGPKAEFMPPLTTGPSVTTTMPSTETTASQDASSSAESSSTTTTPSGQIVHSGRLAYRQSGQIWVSGEDGSGAKAVVASVEGAFSLSPDGRTLVFMQGADTTSDRAVLVDVATGTQASLAATVDLPVWAPDSSWLAYTAGSSSKGYTIRRVNKDGTQDSIVASAAAQPAISPDGKRIAYTRLLASDGVTQAVGVFDIAARTRKTVPQSMGTVSYAFGSSGVLFLAKSRGERALYVVDGAISKASLIGTLPAEAQQQVPGRLLPSPDASHVLFAMVGDDGFSRLTIADVAHKKVKLIDTPRRDATPVGWLLDGTGVLYIDGNWFQKESPNLYRMNVDGTHRVLLVAGARL